MAGRPLSRVHDISQALVDAMQEGRNEEAMALYAKLTDICVRNGIPRPEVPEEVLELSASWWGSRAMKVQQLPAEPSTELDLDTRHVFVKAGQIGARRLLALMEDDSAFGPSGWLTPKAQLDAIGIVLQRAYGSMPNGARFVRLPDGKLEDQQATEKHEERIRVSTIGMMVRRRAAMARGEVVVDGGAEGADDA